MATALQRTILITGAVPQGIRSICNTTQEQKVQLLFLERTEKISRSRMNDALIGAGLSATLGPSATLAGYHIAHWGLDLAWDRPLIGAIISSTGFALCSGGAFISTAGTHNFLRNAWVANKMAVNAAWEKSKLLSNNKDFS